MRRIADYRNYRAYDFERRQGEYAVALSKWGTGSGGESETPVYVIRVAVMASAFKIFSQQKKAHFRSIFMDEVFATMDESRTRRVLWFLKELGRRAAITGGAKGIGFVIASRLTEAGATVALLDNDSTALDLSVDLLRREKANVRPITVELTDQKSLERAFQASIEFLGGLDIWINNAGISPRVPPLEITEQQWNDVLNLNLKAAFSCAKLAAPHMVAHAIGGVIVNMTSSTISRATGNPYTTVFPSMALSALRRVLQLNLVPKESAASRLPRR